MSILLNPFWDRPRAYRLPVTVPAGAVSADLANYPLYIDLATLPGTFWAHVARSDGGDIRVQTAAGVDIPFDLVLFNRDAGTGSLFAKRTLAAAAETTVYIHYGDLSRTPVSPTSPAGRNAVWADYHRVFFLGIDVVDHTGSGNALKLVGTPFGLREFETSPNLGVHQGIAWDGTHYIAIDTNGLKRFDTSWTLVHQNTNPISQFPPGPIDHLGDGVVHNGTLYIPAERFVDINTFSNMSIARFDPTTLDLIDVTDVSAQGHEVSSIALNPADGLLYVSSYNDGSKLWKYHPDTLAFVGVLPLSEAIPRIQGVTVWNGAFWINADTNSGTRRVEMDGTVRGILFNATGGIYEGICHRGDSLLVLHDTSSSGGAGVVRRLEPQPGVAGGGLRCNTGYARSAGLTRSTTWTMGVSAALSSKPYNCAALSYGAASVSNDTDRVALAFRLSSDRFGIWNLEDGWLLDSASPPTNGTPWRLHAVHNGTAGRKVYRNGVETSSGASTGKPSAPGDTLFIGAEDATMAEPFNGVVSFVYLRASVLPPQWLQAETSNLAAPESFYTVGAEEPVYIA